MEAGDIGQHCGLKRLIAYRQGTLPAAEREAVQEHLSLCSRCTGLLRELREFEAAAARGEAGPESLRQEAWDSLVRRLPAETPAVQPAASAARREARPRHLPQLAAAALLFAVAGLALWAAITISQGRQRDDELEARIAELTSELEDLRRTTQAAQEIEVSVAPRFVLRGQEAPGGSFLRAGGAVNPVRKPPQEDRFTVALSLAGQPVYDEYRLELVDRDGKVLWAGRRPGHSLLGDDGTSVSFGGLGPGLYRLRIEGLRPDRDELLAEYLLRIER